MATTDRARTRDGWFAAAGGAVAALLGAGLGELSAALIAPASSPFAAIGGALIDAAPPWAKDTAIAWFGTADKVALLTGIAIVLLAVACVAGLAERRRPPVGVAIAVALGIVGAAVALTRTDAGPLSWLPSLIAGATMALTLRMLMRMLSAQPTVRTDAAPADAPLDRPQEMDRRRFLAWTGGAAAIGLVAVLGATIVSGSSRAVAAIRAALRLPSPAVAAPPVPGGAELNIPGLADVVTPNDSFYRIDTALVVPQVDPADWSLRIRGMVQNEITLTWDELVALPLEEGYATLSCVSNEVGGTLIGNALWLGYPIRELLARARPMADADMVLSRSIDGFTASTPLEALTDPERWSILAVGMNGEPLPLEHGFPVRMVVPGLYGYVSATKWVVDLEVTRFDRATAYWTDRGWSERGPVKLQSRIDVPRPGQGLSAGDTVIAGVAWQPHVGVSRVEVQVDDGPWEEATLATAISYDTWVQWSLPWRATTGRHVLRCRATNALGETQTSDVAGVVPDGATGWHEFPVDVF
ncbi:DMSO/TMAO reductase YedYZ molybdopterin-dependent catalytic subunit [Microbacterium sp. AK009]|uniref:molybdopterin-dependent oxidoreductase n=1 Tax=Microbacterium sp. AK009 TaxID=2723068 RepID=UPI00183F4B69|nr:molybdopterin-dependent oxidoreductase [Microbacterium sp. AK009]NYF16833.1 DMSO/TMAO reductase YedYZ molybdopterin-dependent catalytic subunit [Microbacterium sp. AK009]